MQNPIEQDSDHKSELATAATSTAAAVTILATSNYAVDGNSIQRTSKVGPVSHNSSMGIEGSKLTTTDERGFNISGAIDSNQHHEKKVGIFYNEEHHQQDLNLGGFLKSGEENHKKQTLTRDSESTEKYTKIGSIFRSEEATYKESGPDGTIQGREAETRCCGLKVSSKLLLHK